MAELRTKMFIHHANFKHASQRCAYRYGDTHSIRPTPSCRILHFVYGQQYAIILFGADVDTTSLEPTRLHILSKPQLPLR